MLIFMNIIVLSIHKITMTHNQVDHRIISLRSVTWITPKDIQYHAPIVKTSWYITIGIIITLSAWICQCLDFVPFWIFHYAKIGIGIPS